MYPWDIAKETKETLDMLHDIQEIDAVLAAPWFDEQRAREIIIKHNSKDPLVYAHNNNPATTIPLNMASTKMLQDNLKTIRDYLWKKRTAELAKKAAERDKNHADA